MNWWERWKRRVKLELGGLYWKEFIRECSKMPFDEEHIDPHGECRHEIERLQNEVLFLKRAIHAALSALQGIQKNPGEATKVEIVIGQK